VSRAEPSHPAPPGYRWEVVRSPRWRLVTGKRCRAGASYRKPACGAPSVAELNRRLVGPRESWWAYCGRHLYANWIENDQVVHWRLVEDVAPPGLVAGLCGDRREHGAHVHDSASLGRFWCTADQAQREPGRSERRRHARL